MLSGVASTMLIPETKDISLEDLSREDQEEFIEGIAQETMSRTRPTP